MNPMTHGIIGCGLRRWGHGLMARVASAALILAVSISVGCGDDGTGDDPCDGVTCSGQGECVSVENMPVCDCNSGFHAVGTSCVPDACRPSDCVHGYCVDPANLLECQCDDGYDGDRCDRCADGYVLDGTDGLRCVLDASCDQDPCGDHGDCRQDGAGVSCDCHDGWDGSVCDRCADGYHDEDGACVLNSPCNPDPCVHASKCEEIGGSAKCTCLEGYAGDTCDECAEGFVNEGLECVPGPGPCDANPCPDLHPGEHRDRCEVQGDDAVCLCDFGYDDVEGVCTEQVVCDPETTCASHGSCTGNGLECKCDDGYDGANCDACADGWEPQGSDCVPVEPPDPCDPNPCGAEPDRGRCVATGGVAVCACDEGFDEVAGVCVPRCDVDESACAQAHSSFGWIVSANGHGALVVNTDPLVLPDGADRDNHRYMLFVHPYQTWGLNGSGQQVNTRDVLYDTFMGLRVDGVGTWLDGLARDYVGYYGQDGIPHWVQTVDGLRVETFLYAPWQLGRPSVVMLTRVSNPGTTARQVSLYSVQNWHVGNTLNDSHKFPDTTGEEIARDGTSGGFMEKAAGGAVFHYPLGTVGHYSAGAAGSTYDPWLRLNAGLDLGDVASIEAGDNRVCGFQAPQQALEPGQTAWFGVVSAFDPNKDSTTLQQDVVAAFGGMDAQQVLAQAKAEWASWRKPEPAGLSAAERMVYRTAEAVLRMGQVWETTDKSKGQILASLPPGMWATSWPRDMAYSIAALVRSGHYTEARAALEFMLLADANGYKTFDHNGLQTGVGADYRISVCRYFGRGMEESDWNADGPNVEFDGFGLFLGVLGEYYRASRDATIIEEHWATIRDEIANVLVGLRAGNGMIRPDSSIWEVHWNGRQKQYSYTSLAAAKGLCEASIFAGDKGAASEQTAWEQAARDIVTAVLANAMDGDFMAQSVEELTSDTGYVDAAVIEAFRWNLIDPRGAEAAATVDGLLSGLVVPNGIGLARNDDGGWYDSSEWILIDLRVSGALRTLGGETDVARADQLLDWVTAQARANMGLIAELHTREGSNYDGAVPMVGFGAGAYLLETWQRAEPVTPEAPCGITW